MHACMYVCMYVCMHACNRKDKKMGMVNSSDFIAGFVGAKSDRSEGMIFLFPNVEHIARRYERSGSKAESVGSIRLSLLTQQLLNIRAMELFGWSYKPMTLSWIHL